MKGPTPPLRVKKLRDDARLPRYMSAGAAGMDLFAAMDAPLELAPLQRAVVSTGLAVALAPGFEGQVRPRSGLARKHGITVANAPGTIDADYRGELGVLLVNLSDEVYSIEPGERVAQLVVAPVVTTEIVEVAELDATDRGEGGFGSTGQ